MENIWKYSNHTGNVKVVKNRSVKLGLWFILCRVESHLVGVVIELINILMLRC